MPLIIELKSYDPVDILCPLVWEILKDYKGEYCIESFDPKIVAWFKTYHPHVLRGQLMAHFTGKEPEFNSGSRRFLRAISGRMSFPARILRRTTCMRGTISATASPAA